MPHGKLVALTLLAMLATPLAHAQEYYRQNPVDTFGGYSSQDARNAGGLGWFSEVADNFAGEAGWGVNRVECWGGYAQAPASPGNTRGFTVRFYADNEGRPGARLYEQEASSFTRTEYYVTPPSSTFPNGLAGYHYVLELPAPFAIATPGQYWMSVVAILDRGGGSLEPQWGWGATTQPQAPSAVQWFFSPGNFQPVNTDFAFVLANAGAGCPADMDDGSGTGTTDGSVTIDDLLYFLARFEEGDTAADLDDGSGTGTPDDAVTIEDLLYYLVRFDAGC